MQAVAASFHGNDIEVKYNGFDPGIVSQAFQVNDTDERMMRLGEPHQTMYL
jgi:hypothetical protein